jgi:threonine dehydratase
LKQITFRIQTSKIVYNNKMNSHSIPNTTDSTLSLEHIQRASKSIDPIFRNSPQFESEPLSSAIGCDLVLKIETLNPIRSFKGRGADYFVSTVEPDAKLVCASAGNFGQAMAYACRKRGMPLTVFASVNANPLKLERMRALGANLILEGEDFDGAKLAAKRYAKEIGAQMIEDGLEPRISEGAGTIGLELAGYAQPLDVVLVPLGNGALATGVGRAIKAQSPQTRVIAVSASGAPAMEQSWRTQELVTLDSIQTFADGIGVRVPVPEAVAEMSHTIDEVILIEDAATLNAMKLLHQHLGLIVEPSGAIGVAAAALERFRGARVATIICGGNLTEVQIREWIF